MSRQSTVSNASLQPSFQRERPIQNFPDYLRHVARKSKAGFDRVHGEIYRIYYGTALDKKDLNGNGGSKAERRERWANSSSSGGLLWSSTGSLKPQSSFTSYIAEEPSVEDNASEEKDLLKPDPTREKPHSASKLDKTNIEFKFDNFRYSDTSLEDNNKRYSREDETADYQLPYSWKTSKGNEDSPSTNTCTSGNGQGQRDCPNLQVPENDKPFTLKDDGYLRMDQRRQLLNINNQTDVNDYIHCNSKADYKNIDNMRRKKQIDNGDYMNAPRKPMRSCIDPPSLGEDDIYKVPPSTTNAPVTVSPTKKPMPPKKPTNIDKRKKCSTANINGENDDIYEVPPSSVRSVSPVNIIVTNTDYQVPPSPVKVDNKKPAPTPRLSKLHVPMKDNIDYEVPPSPKKLDKLGSGASSYENHSIDQGTKMNPMDEYREFYSYTVDQVVERLNECFLPRMAEVCIEQQINGEYFRRVRPEDLQEKPFEMNWFYIARFLKVLDGWKPSAKSKSRNFE